MAVNTAKDLPAKPKTGPKGKLGLAIGLTASAYTKIEDSNILLGSVYTSITQEGGSLHPTQLRRMVDTSNEQANNNLVNLLKTDDKIGPALYQLTEERGDTIRQQAASTKHFLDIYFGSDSDRAGIEDPNKIRLTALGVENEIKAVKALAEEAKTAAEAAKVQAEQNNTLLQTIDKTTSNTATQLLRCMSYVLDVFDVVCLLGNHFQNIIRFCMLQFFPLSDVWGSSKKTQWGPNSDYKTKYESPISKVGFNFSPRPEDMSDGSTAKEWCHANDEVSGPPHTSYYRQALSVSFEYASGFPTGFGAYASPYHAKGEPADLYCLGWDLPQAISVYYYPSYHENI